MHSPLRLRPAAVMVKLALACLAVGQAHAAEPVIEPANVLSLDDVVVTASGFEQNLEDAPASMTVITGDELRKKSFRDLTDALRDVEGVTVNGGANETDISIRGMPADYTLILVDGKRQSARESRVNGNSGYEQSFIPPAEAIERIEVVRGPMSSLYGSDAIGGVINIITRKVTSKWGGSVTYDYSARQHSDQGNARQTQFFLGGPIKEDLLGLQVWGRYLDRQADDDVETTNGFSKADHRDLTARLSFTPTIDHDILLEAGATRLKNGDGVSANWATREQENNRDHWSISHQGRWGWATSDVSLAYEKSSREGEASATQTDVLGRKPEVENRVLDAKLVMPTERNITTTGLQWNDTTVTDWNQGLGDRKDYEFSVVQKALFAENEWSVTDTFALTTGLRMDHHEQYGVHFSPRVYGVWRATDDWTIKGGVARGFKAPEVRAVVPGYSYLRRNRFVMFGNPDLKPETSTNYELSALWSNRNDLSAGVTVFYNDFQDKLSTVTTTEVWNGFIVMDRVNVDKAVIKGVELNGRWDITPAVAIKGNYTYTDSEQKSGANAGAPLALTPEQKANLRAEWKLNDRTQLWASTNYYGKEYGNTLTDEAAPGYTTADLGGSYELSKNISLNAALYNVADKRLDDETYGTVNYGRTLWASTTVRF
ncbi:outer membrane receptor for ferrienterochelin and colicins [Pseudomonas syringae]|uniref:TonB-dependent receptor domain-containing protein n=1 Tax=Pseudomonas syringae TaxID=317 RepID=UPI000896A947|nr:TonB-dependent receptor [Pseudomonas syringae]SDX61730.1 outer membrane receptor for ferrienterochelin and colicins [Pseudomonas syringae]SFM71135.1 outer membrane receptor for ferrienterochelin and colicins [Pseudomonas syringae]